jgi:hypothetical protein
MTKQTSVKQRTRTITVDVCGICNADCASHHDTCTGCGMAVCQTCRPHLKVYEKRVFLYGDDVQYCLSCLSKLHQKPTPLFLALQSIADLRQEYSRWREDYERRVDLAEARVRSLM